MDWIWALIWFFSGAFFVIEIVFFALLFAGRNARAILWASLKRKGLDIFINEDRTVVIKPIEKPDQAQRDKDEVRFVNSSVYIWDRRPVRFYYGNIGSNLDLKVVAFSQEAKKNDIKDYDEAEVIDSYLKSQGKQGLVFETKNPLLLTFDHVKDFFKYQVNANYFKAINEKEKAKLMREFNWDKWRNIVTLVAIVGIVVMVGGILWYVFFDSSNKISIQACQAMINSIKQQAVSSQASQVINQSVVIK